MIKPSALRDLLDYDPTTGSLMWRERPREMFKSDWSHGMWNARNAGKPALSTNGHGYLHGSLLGKNTQAHRAIWALVYGVWPPSEIDHINGVSTDNRIENLRLATRKENTRNTKRPSTNTSGVSGVVAHRKKWTARIQVDGENKYLGVFSSFDEAVAARKVAEVEYGFHRNHGRVVA